MLGRDYIAPYCAILFVFAVASIWFGRVGHFFYASLAGCIIYSSLLIWFLLPFIKQKLPIIIGRSLFRIAKVVEGWDAIFLSLIFLVPLIAAGVVIEILFPINIYSFLISLPIGGGVSYWFFSKTTAVKPF